MEGSIVPWSGDLHRMGLKANSFRIAVIGPVFPFKGGIAHYTGLLAKELAVDHDVLVVSYSLQYPDFLYPGCQQKDYENDSFKIDGTKYLLNSINPFTWVTTCREIMQFHPDIVILPWFNPFFGPVFFTITSLLKVFCRCKVLFLIHNVLPHERLPLDWLIAKITLKRGDFHIVQSGESEDNLLKLLKNPICRKLTLPALKVFPNGQMITRKVARERLSLPDDAPVLLFFGFVREYKGLMYLIDALPAIRDRLPDVKLLVAGDFYDDKERYLRRIEAIGVGPAVGMYDQYIPDRDVELYFKAADLIVLPYVSASQSGIAQIALEFGKPLVVTSVGGLPEVVEDCRTGFVVPPKNPEALANAIVRFFLEEKGEKFSSAIMGAQERFSWRRFVTCIEELITTK